MLISDGAYSFLRGYFADIRDLNNVQLACNMIFGKKNKDSLYSYLVELRREREPMLLIKSCVVGVEEAEKEEVDVIGEDNSGLWK